MTQRHTAGRIGATPEMVNYVFRTGLKLVPCARRASRAVARQAPCFALARTYAVNHLGPLGAVLDFNTGLGAREFIERRAAADGCAVLWAFRFGKEPE